MCTIIFEMYYVRQFCPKDFQKGDNFFTKVLRQIGGFKNLKI